MCRRIKRGVVTREGGQLNTDSSSLPYFLCRRHLPNENAAPNASVTTYYSFDTKKMKDPITSLLVFHHDAAVDKHYHTAVSTNRSAPTVLLQYDIFSSSLEHVCTGTG